MSVSRLLSRGSVWLPAATAVLAWHVAAAGPAADGWLRLRQNQNVEAGAAFRVALKQNPADPEALRGLGLLALQEDSAGAALQAWRRLYQQAPSHWSAVAYWPRMVELARQTGQWTLLEAAARDVLAAKSAPPELRASAQLALAEAADRAGRSAEAEKVWAQLGYLRQWRVIGPFENVSRSGFAKCYEPERALDFGRSYPGKEEQTLPWHRLEIVTRDGQCPVGACLGDRNGGVFYAATAVFSSEARSAVLAFDPTGASKIYLNGDLILADEIAREHQALIADPFQVAVTLHKGWNPLWIKLAVDEKQQAAFALRLTSASGASLPNLRLDPSQAQGASIDSGAAAAAPVAVPAAVIRLRTRAPTLEPEVAAALAYLLRQARDDSAAAELLKAALARAPKLGWLHWELSETLQQDEQVDEARAERKLALRENPRLIAAALEDLQDEKNAEPPAERLRRLKGLLKISPQSAEVRWALAEAYEEAELPAEATKAATAAVVNAGGPEARLRLVQLYLDHDRKADAESALSAALRAAPNSPPLLMERALLDTEAGRLTAAAADYQRLLGADPAELPYRFALAGLYQAMNDTKRAVAVLRAARPLYPQNGDLCARLADRLHETGNSPEAITLYRSAIRLAPARVALREKLQLLLGERPVADLAPATPAQPILARTPKAADVPGASAVSLLDEERVVVYPDYATVSHTHDIIKVLDAAGVERFQQFLLSAPSASAVTTVESARILKADGKVQDVTEDAVGSSVALPSLAPGDVIDIAYRVEDFRRGGLARQFWAQWFFATSHGPSKLSRYVLITPPQMALQFRGHGAVPEPSVKELKGWRIREWRMTDIPEQKQEEMGAGHLDGGLWLDVSTVSSWRQIVEWYQDLSGPRCVPDAVVRAQAAELTKHARTEEEKLRAIIAFVTREIRYQTTPFRMSAFVPTEGRQVLRERYGDCKDKASLLTALLAAVGIKSEMALLSGRSQGVTPLLPSPRFSHAIARVQTQRGPLWVDATADQIEFGGLPFEDQQVPALVIADATTDLTLTPALPVERNQLSDTHHGVLGPDGTLKADLELEARGDWAWILRAALRSVPEAKREEYLRSMASTMVENARYESGSVEQLADPEKPLAFRLQYHAEHFSSTAGSFLLARLPWSQPSTMHLDELLSQPGREQDLEVAMLRGRYVSSVRLELPAGYVPQDLPPQVSGESPWGSYRITYRIEGNLLQARSEITMAALRVPARDLPRYVEFLRGIEQEMRRQLVFKKS